MSIEGTKREVTDLPDFIKKVGLFEAKVVAVNPTLEEYKTILGIDLKDHVKAAEYLGKSNDGNDSVRVDIWLENLKKAEGAEHGQRLRVTFFLEDKIRENKDGSKRQYINSVGTCCWAEDTNSLPVWFTGEATAPREYRSAYTGEEELYGLLRAWFGKLDLSKGNAELILPWSKLIKGNVKDIREQIDGEWSAPFVALAAVNTKVKEGETKEYQTVYNKAFLPAFCLRNFRLIDYSLPEVIDKLKSKDKKKMSTNEKIILKFVLNVTGEYGCKDFYVLKEMKDYDPKENLVASDKPISSDGSDY